MEWFVLVLFMADLILHVATDKGRFWTKSLLVPLLILYYCLAVAIPDPWVILALLAGLAGDVLLFWPQKPIFFMLGLGSFLVGHLGYAAVFLISTDGLAMAQPELFLLVLPYLLYIGVLYGFLRQKLGGMKPAVLFYALTLSAMSFLALSRLLVTQGAALWLPFAGSLFFIVSDTLLALHHFRKPIQHDCVKVMLTYAIAQLLMVLGLSL